MFRSVPGVPCGKVERFAGVDTQTCASPHLKLPLHVVGEGFGVRRPFAYVELTLN
jgi:hypothetical protein